MPTAMPRRELLDTRFSKPVRLWLTGVQLLANIDSEWQHSQVDDATGWMFDYPEFWVDEPEEQEEGGDHFAL